MERLTRLRKLKGFSQRALAKESAVSPATIYELENGRRKPNPSTLRKLATALGVEVADLIEESETLKAPTPPSPEQPPLNGFEEERRPYDESAVHARIELLESVLDLWEEQIDRGQFDLETIRKMDSVAYRLAIDHTLSPAGTGSTRHAPGQSERLITLENRITREAVGWGRIWDAFQARLEEEVAEERLTREQIVAFEHFRAERAQREAQWRAQGLANHA